MPHSSFKRTAMEFGAGVGICKSNSMIILNGRIGFDKGVGRTTQKVKIAH